MNAYPMQRAVASAATRELLRATIQRVSELSLEPQARDILTLRSEIAKPVLTRMLSAAGHRVRSVVAYRTVGVPVTDRIAEDVRSGRINAVLVTSGSVAEQVHQQFPDLPSTTLIAAIGPRTAKDARRAGLNVDVEADRHDTQGLLTALLADANH